MYNKSSDATSRNKLRDNWTQKHDRSPPAKQEKGPKSTRQKQTSKNQIMDKNNRQQTTQTRSSCWSHENFHNMWTRFIRCSQYLHTQTMNEHTNKTNRHKRTDKQTSTNEQTDLINIRWTWPFVREWRWAEKRIWQFLQVAKHDRILNRQNEI